MSQDPVPHVWHQPEKALSAVADNLHNDRPDVASGGPERVHLPVLIGRPTTAGKILEALAEPIIDGPEAEAHRAGYEWLLGYRETENTARSYARGLEAWFTFCRGYNVDPLEAPRQLVERFKASLFDQGLKPATVNHRLAILASFYKYCGEEGLLAGRNPTLGVRRSKLPNESMSTGLTREELNAFLAEAKKRGPMMFSLMTLLALNGLRASEPLESTVEDVGTMRGHYTLAIARKGAKRSKVRIPLAPMTARAMDDWLAERANLLGQLGRGNGLLFFGFRYNRAGEPRALERRDVWRFVRSIGAKSVPNKPSLHPHDLRHAFVTLGLDAGVDLRSMRDSAGHASADTTSRYDRGRNNMDKHATYTLAAYLAGNDST